MQIPAAKQKAERSRRPADAQQAGSPPWESLNIQINHVDQVVCSFTAAAVQENIVKSFRPAAIGGII
jgi:hypothetical protein